jgi:N-acetylglucosaminyldiphosphoundecaprenol N-acetyl-beta-D-mannosaminyltransferase
MTSVGSPSAGAHHARPDRTDLFLFGGLALAPLTVQDACDWVIAQALMSASCIVVTAHISHLMFAARDRAFGDVVERSELTVADGWPLVLASRLFGPALPGRVIGIDLVQAALDAGVRLRLAILGGPPGAAEALAARERGRHDVAIVEPLPMHRWDTPEERRALVERVSAAQPNLVLIGLGVPRQELLADDLRPHVCGPILCCGATIPVLGGHVRRAPRLVRQVGLEWAYRIIQSPIRLGPRYLRSGSWFMRLTVGEVARRFRRAVGSRLHA